VSAGPCWARRACKSELRGSIFAKRNHSEFAADVPLDSRSLISILSVRSNLRSRLDLVAAKPLQLIRIECLAERLLANQRPVRQFLLPIIEPRQHLAFKEATQTLDIGGGRLLALLRLVGVAGQHIGPPSLGISSRSAASAAS
jgi:hypothetical protein